MLVVVVDAAAVVAAVIYICTRFHCELKDCISQSICMKGRIWELVICQFGRTSSVHHSCYAHQYCRACLDCWFFDYIIVKNDETTGLCHEERCQRSYRFFLILQKLPPFDFHIVGCLFYQWSSMSGRTLYLPRSRT
jgi:hypothetical protein